MFRKIDRNKKLFFIAIISLFIPGTYFSATRTDINLYVIQQIFYTTLFVFSFAIILSLILKKIIKKNFLHTLSSILLSFFIFFTYSHIARFADFLFGNIKLKNYTTFLLGKNEQGEKSIRRRRKKNADCTYPRNEPSDDNRSFEKNQ